MDSDISVVIPTLGRLSLERTLVSASGQSERPGEIIVVSNGRERLDTERVAALTQLAESVPVIVLSLPPFSGPSISRNTGCWEAASEYVAFVDDDDELAPGYLAAMWARIQQDRPDVLYGAKIWQDPDGSVRREKRLVSVEPGSWFEALYRQENPGFGGTNLVVRRSKFFDLGGFATDLHSGEDRAFAMAALKAHASIAYVDGAVVLCHDPDGYRAKGRPDKWITNLKLIHRYWNDVSWCARLRTTWRWARSLRRATPTNPDERPANSP
jgi:glycosyltransferase involved in cell wall biosynthesis